MEKTPYLKVSHFGKNHITFECPNCKQELTRINFPGALGKKCGKCGCMISESAIQEGVHSQEAEKID